ncbi:MAG: HAD-IA family hydrolase [Candidatus Eisenbacteria sp.]|nr:HAD-IA family hydrolase [Candidatus Eisenbacteria bacterium]
MTGGVLFDFDGTLVDTFDDIVEGVQRMREQSGGPRLSTAAIRRHVGWGAGNLVGQCHPRLDDLRPDRLPPDGEPLPLDAAEIESALQSFRQFYDQIFLEHSRPYDGIPELLGALARDGFDLAVVSNKPERFVRQMLAGLGLIDPLRVVLGGDSLPVCKPDPEPLRAAAAQMGLPAERCLMVGDGPLDIAAAQAAGIPGCAVSWGLLPEAELIALGPACLVHSVAELEAWIRKTLRAIAYSPAPAGK